MYNPASATVYLLDHTPLKFSEDSPAEALSHLIGCFLEPRESGDEKRLGVSERTLRNISRYRNNPTAKLATALQRAASGEPFFENYSFVPDFTNRSSDLLGSSPRERRNTQQRLNHIREPLFRWATRRGGDTNKYRDEMRNGVDLTRIDNPDVAPIHEILIGGVAANCWCHVVKIPEDKEEAQVFEYTVNLLMRLLPPLSRLEDFRARLYEWAVKSSIWSHSSNRRPDPKDRAKWPYLQKLYRSLDMSSVWEQRLEFNKHDHQAVLEQIAYVATHQPERQRQIAPDLIRKYETAGGEERRFLQGRDATRPRL